MSNPPFSDIDLFFDIGILSLSAIALFFDSGVLFPNADALFSGIDTPFFDNSFFLGINALFSDIFQSICAPLLASFSLFSTLSTLFCLLQSIFI